MKTFKFKNLFLIAVVFCLTFCGCAQPVANNGGFKTDISLENLFGVNSNEQFLGSTSQNESKRLTVKINANNGSPIQVIYVMNGEKVEKPADPVFGNHIFLGWFAKGEAYDFDAPVTENLNIVGLWEKVYDSTLYSVIGSTTAIDGGFKTSSNGAMIMANDTQGFDRGSIEVTVSSTTASDSGIIFCLETNGATLYWESNVSYYFFFVNIEGFAYLGRVDNGRWAALKVLPIANFTQGNSYTLKVVLNGTDIYCFIDGKLHIAYSEYRFLTGTGFGLRTGSQDVTFTNFSVNGKCQ